MPARFGKGGACFSLPVPFLTRGFTFNSEVNFGEAARAESSAVRQQSLYQGTNLVGPKGDESDGLQPLGNSQGLKPPTAGCRRHG